MSDPDGKLLTLADVTGREQELVRVLEPAEADPTTLRELLQAGRYRKPLLIDDAQRRGLYLQIGDAIQSEMRFDDPIDLVSDYTRKMMGFLLFCPQPRQIVMLGLGGGSLLKFCHVHLPQTRFTAVEIDADVIAMRSHFRIPPDDARLAIAHADGARYVADMVDAGEQTDVLLVDAFDRGGLARSVATHEFLNDARRVLTDCGVFVMNLEESDPGSAELLRMIHAEFGDPVIPVDIGWGNTVVFAGPALRDPGRLANVGSRAQQVREELGLGFPRLRRLIDDYLLQGRPDAGW